jgi:hypothetical protein
MGNPDGAPLSAGPSLKSSPAPSSRTFQSPAATFQSTSAEQERLEEARQRAVIDAAVLEVSHRSDAADAAVRQKFGELESRLLALEDRESKHHQDSDMVDMKGKIDDVQQVLSSLLQKDRSAELEIARSEGNLLLQDLKDQMEALQMEVRKYQHNTMMGEPHTSLRKAKSDSVIYTIAVSPHIDSDVFQVSPRKAKSDTAVDLDNMQARLRLLRVQGEVATLKEVTVADQEEAGRSQSDSGIAKIRENERFREDVITRSGKLYQFHETVWDTVFFLWLPGVDRLSSLLGLFALLVSTFVQVMFLLVVWEANRNSDPHSDEVMADLRNWRSSRYPPSGALPSFCPPSQQDVVTVQSETFFHAEEYFPIDFKNTTTLQHIANGPCLAILAVWCWLCYCAIEVRDSILVCLAVWRMRHEHEQGKTRLVISDDKASEHLYEFRKVCISRLVFLFICGLIRFLIAVVLCLVGSIYLFNTVQAEDLLLNSMALSFIIQLDEMFYTALVPRLIQTLHKFTAPLKMPEGRDRERACLNPGVTTSLATYGLLLVCFLCALIKVSDVAKQAVDVQEILCG